MTHARSYKNAYPVERAIAEINRSSATQFDPLDAPRFCGHLNAWVRRTRQEGCGVHATQSSPLPGGVPS